MNRVLAIIATLLISLTQANAKVWQAEWITSPSASEQSNSWFCFHKSVVIDDLGDKPAFADIAVDSKYWLWINGEMVVFEGGLKRGPSPDNTYYDHVDITHYLRRGENTIALLVWHFGKEGFSHKNSVRMGLIFDCHTDTFSILSDNTWLCHHYTAYEQTEGTQANFRLAESNVRFNAQQAIDGWYAQGSKPSFPHAVSVGKAGCEPWNKLIERPIPLWRDYGISDYLSIVKEQDDDHTIYRCRLPYNCHVTPYLDIEAEAGRLIHIQTDDYMGGGEPNVRAEYVTRSGKQQYESLGWMNGHEVIYRIPNDVKVTALRYRETGYDTDFSGTFLCDDDFLNRLRTKALRTLYVTMRDTYMDCPDRERSQWWGDEVNELGEAFYALDSRGQLLARKGILELVNWQREDGVLYSPCPSVIWRNELPAQMLASVGYYGFYTWYLYSGDESIIRHIYDPVKRYLHEVWQMDNEGLVVTRHGDWSWGDWGDNIDLDLLLNCWYYLALKAEREYALILDKQSDVEMIEAKMEGMRKSFNSRFWQGNEYRTPGYEGKTDDRGQAMAVLAGFAPKEYYPAILKVLQREHHASPYMEKYVGEALFRMGYADYALQRTRERFDKMVNHPTLTTLWEGWGIGSEGFGGGSTNHAWSGGTLTLLSQYVAGISPIEPGFKEFRIAPQMGNLSNAIASVETPYGTIRVSILCVNDVMNINFEVPTGTVAHITKRGKDVTFGAGSHHISLSRE